MRDKKFKNNGCLNLTMVLGDDTASLGASTQIQPALYAVGVHFTCIPDVPTVKKASKMGVWGVSGKVVTINMTRAPHPHLRAGAPSARTRQRTAYIPFVSIIGTSLYSELNEEARKRNRGG